jgi:phosphoadenosine phosphosulfate reductase
MDVNTLQAALENLDLEARLRVLCQHSSAVVCSTSLGQEDQVLSDAIFRQALPIRIFTLDTGRLFEETLQLVDVTQAKYRQPIQTYFPESQAVESLVAEFGQNGFYQSVEARKACCQVRKIDPLVRALQGAEIWLTGLRAEQSDNRSQMPLVEWDARFGLLKVNPLLEWTYEQVLDYLKIHRVPDNPLHRRGFVSIGCAPCTRAIEPGEHPRAGRWWWEQSQKECGLHQAK